MRGKDLRNLVKVSFVRITPAYAGKSIKCIDQLVNCQDHPRVCGEKQAIWSGEGEELGSPPRMRGKAVRPDRKGHRQGITPAYAGKSTCGLLPIEQSQDHPRVCGEKRFAKRGNKAVKGSPPRMRGKD